MKEKQLGDLHQKIKEYIDKDIGENTEEIFGSVSVIAVNDYPDVLISTKSDLPDYIFVKSIISLIKNKKELKEKLLLELTHLSEEEERKKLVNDPLAYVENYDVVKVALF